LAASELARDHISRNNICPRILLSRVQFIYIYDLCVLVATSWTSEPSILIAGRSSHCVMNLRAPLRVASFAIRTTSKIRSRHDFRLKYGCLGISRGDAKKKSFRERERETYKEKIVRKEVFARI